MNSYAVQCLAAFLSASQPIDLASESDHVGVNAAGAPSPAWADAAADPLYFLDRLPNSPDVPTPLVGQSSSGRGEAGPRGDCADCENTEGEVNCAIPLDTMNGGCNSSPPVFSDLGCGELFCGTSATNGFVRDTDWWAFAIEERSIVRVDVVAEFQVQVAIGDVNAGCPIAELTVGAFGEACAPTHVSATLAPGTYVVFVAPQFTAPVSCGAPYSGAIECTPCPCAGDFDVDRQVGLSDLALILSNFGASASNPCMDSDLDGQIGIQDLASFLPEFGVICP